MGALGSLPLAGAGRTGRRSPTSLVALSDPALTPLVERAVRGTGVQVLGGGWDHPDDSGPRDRPRVERGIVGAVGLRGTWAALEAGKTVALANKETLVVAGPLVMELARRAAHILPVDSEHSAIFQALKAGSHQDVRRVILTSSGGPFRGQTRKQLSNVTPDDALKHPTWQMGPKITIDSATLMNKAWK